MDPAIRALFAPQPGLTYLDSATYGLPPEPTLRVMREALEGWQAGTAYWVDDWDRHGERARVAFARLLGTEARRVALLPAVSVGTGTIAADLRPGDRVVVPAAEFTSVLFPLLVARQRGVDVVEVEDDDGLIEAISPGTRLVALTLVQMQTGLVAPIRDVLAAAEAVGAEVLLDATHGTPFVRYDDVLDRLDYVLVSGYKHVLCPRGVAFMVVGDDHIDRLPPILANWRAADEPYARFFGGPLTLAEGAAQYDVSLAWFDWLGAATSLELLVEWQATGALAEPLALARDLAARLEVPWGGSTVVCPPIDDPARVRAVLAEHRIKASFRGTGVRLSTHVYNDTADIERAASALAPVVARPKVSTAAS